MSAACPAAFANTITKANNQNGKLNNLPLDLSYTAQRSNILGSINISDYIYSH